MKAATQMKGKVNFGAYDATANRKYSQIYEVKGFPTIKGFVDGGEPVDYEGGRTAKQLASWYSFKKSAFVKPEPEPPAAPMFDSDSVSILIEKYHFATNMN